MQSGHWDYWSWVLIILPFGLLGLIAGRFPRLLVLVFAPMVVAWVYYRRHYGGPDDDVTGLAATAFAIVGMGAFLSAALVSWLARAVWRWARPGDEETGAV